MNRYILLGFIAIDCLAILAIYNHSLSDWMTKFKQKVKNKYTKVDQNKLINKRESWTLIKKVIQILIVIMIISSLIFYYYKFCKNKTNVQDLDQSFLVKHLKWHKIKNLKIKNDDYEVVDKIAFTAENNCYT